MAKIKSSSKVGSLVSDILTNAQPKNAPVSSVEKLPAFGLPALRKWAGYTESVASSGKIIGSTQWGESEPVDIDGLVKGAWEHIDKSIQSKMTVECENALARFGKDVMAMTYLRMSRNGVQEEIKTLNLQAIEKLARKMSENAYTMSSTHSKAIGLEQQVLRFVVAQQVDYKTGKPVKREFKEPLSYRQRMTV